MCRSPCFGRYRAANRTDFTGIGCDLAGIAAPMRETPRTDFITKVLTDLNDVRDQVEHGRTLISAHKSAKTYGEEMRGLIQAGSWDWTVDTVADFTGHVSVWLTSWMVFQQTGTWIVGEHGNTAGYHLGVIKPNDRCWCRSGKKYRKCHMQQDQILALRGR